MNPEKKPMIDAELVCVTNDGGRLFTRRIPWRLISPSRCTHKWWWGDLLVQLLHSYHIIVRGVTEHNRKKGLDTRSVVVETKDEMGSTDVENWWLVAAVVEFAGTEVVPTTGGVALTRGLEFMRLSEEVCTKFFEYKVINKIMMTKLDKYVEKRSFVKFENWLTNIEEMECWRVIKIGSWLNGICNLISQ